MTSSRPDLASAVSRMLDIHSENPWFIRQFWPEAEARVSRILGDLLRLSPPPARVLDVGCFNGFLCDLLVGLGYQTMGLDAWEDPSQPGLGERQIEFLKLNLNEARALSSLESESLDAVVAGEVIEHVLNHPLGILRDLARSLRPEGLLILTTPNPGTLMNASRLLLQRPLLWGTEEFFRQKKFEDDNIICAAHIHYREYQTPELLRMVDEAGFEVESVAYVPIGSSIEQGRIKRIVKSNPLSRKLLQLRCFGSTHYVVARRR